jgi:sulfur-carrier protein adenylyltransferase/sulfurtransferase
MPDGNTSGFESRWLSSAISDVQTLLTSIGGTFRVLTSVELRPYRARGITHGWRLEVQFSDRLRCLNLLIDNRFPRTQARVALAEPPPLLSMPHVEDDGVLCLLPDPSTIDPFSPVKAVQHVLHLACDLIDEINRGDREQDFCQEFLSYWDKGCRENGPTIQSLLKAEGPSRLVKVWLGRERYVVANQQEEIIHWLGNLLQDAESGKRECHEALLLWLERPLIPKEYPRTATDLQKIARANGAEVLLERLTTNDELFRIVVILGAPTANGPCFGGVVVYPPDRNHLLGGHASDKINAGFRPGKVPRALQVARYFSNARIAHTNVSRVDSSWVHGRDQEKRHSVCRDARVAIIGCGSVGSSVASLLAKSGVGHLFLVDPQKLVWANIGRHVLGADTVGKFKAEALSDRIRRELPHLASVEARPQSWEELTENDLGKLSSMDLIVSTMGNWPAEGMLNEWHLTQIRRFPIVYGWTEPHGVAGHAVAVCSQGGCLQCGVDVTARCSIRVAEWPQGATDRQEPACGAYYQPYGPIEAENAVDLIAELCLDCLLKDVTVSTHRIWAARKALVDRAGGIWTPEWTEIAQGRDRGAFVEERIWPVLEACPECGVPRP